MNYLIEVHEREVKIEQKCVRWKHEHQNGSKLFLLEGYENDSNGLGIPFKNDIFSVFAAVLIDGYDWK